MKSFRPKDDADEPPDRRPQRRAATSTASSGATTPTPRPPIREARLFRKGPGKEARLCFMGHLLMENRHGLVVDAAADRRRPGRAERGRPVDLIGDVPGRHRITVGADRAYDAADFVAGAARASRPRRTSRRTLSGRRSRSTAGPSAIPATARASGRASGSRRRSRWVKTIAGPGQDQVPRHRPGRLAFTLAAAAYNLIRLPKLLEALP